ncbi:MAG: trypsin-like peptidase domain-containing protein [Leptolyngbya sp. UWPOB_LEPTO1]|uniref:S1C family serine protease n=1 Tax=Leptolyngbya sp. UWPOB_LEPTO1 TaxID=2815653 RepID=UPI001AD0B635|nr:serine protease [Leptolyngbya sp. UWPOB_LEPTO1]MBN8564216.1 trypsin-like peptidase domain-containing protein [Leptolyngbya sp. UWPOB_LEPTO1]
MSVQLKFSPIYRWWKNWFILLLSFLTSFSVVACQQPSDPSLKPDKIASYNKPGIVLVHAQHQADISYPEPVLDSEKFQQLQAEVAQRLSNGKISSKAEAVTLFIKEVLGNPVQYMRPGSTREEQVKVPSFGTGFIITDDGTVATAAHVVSHENESMKRKIAQTALVNTTREYCKKGIRELASDDRVREALSQTTNPRELLAICESGFEKYYAEHLRIGRVSTDTNVVLPSTNPGQTNTPKVMSSEIKKTGQSVPGQDVALLKMSGQNFPIVTLSDDIEPSTGGSVYSLGYPGDITKMFINQDRRDLPEPSLTAGIISAVKRPAEGGEVLQANIAISPGNSGGPLLDSRGEAIGLASFVALNDKEQQVEGAGFFVPIKTLKQLLQAAGITPQESKLMRRYHRGIDFLQRKQFGQALKEFEEVRNLNPDFPYIQQLIAKSQAAPNK